jgi:hypothetical protein
VACEQTNTNLKAGEAALTISPADDGAHCTECGRSCCNCELCMKEKRGRKNICGPCLRAELAAKGAA